MFTSKTLYEGGPEYNFVIYDSRGLTYYFYNMGMNTDTYPKVEQSICIVAVQDEYGNMIRYDYGESYTDLIKITDTYGREININELDGGDGTIRGNEISYYDDVSGQTIYWLMVRVHL